MYLFVFLLEIEKVGYLKMQKGHLNVKKGGKDKNR